MEDGHREPFVTHTLNKSRAWKPLVTVKRLQWAAPALMLVSAKKQEAADG